jgi:integrase
MGRRQSGALPQMRRHKPTNTARMVIDGKVHSLGRWGSDEARMRYDTFIAAYVTSGRSSIEAARAVLGKPAPGRRPAVAVAPAPVAPAQPAPAADKSGGLTVGELCTLYLRHIKATAAAGKQSSRHNRAVAASRALRPLAMLPAATFGTRAFLEARQRLIDTPMPSRRKPREDELPEPPKRMSRRYINDVMQAVRQMFDWGVLHELVPDDRAAALRIVKPLQMGESKARETAPRKPVRPSVVRATLPYLTAEVADLIWFVRLTGCRPSEARRMKLCRIRDRDKPVWRYVPKRHKTAHRGKQRHIAIGPQAQAIVLAHTAGRSPTDYVFTPQRSVPPRKAKPGTIPMQPRQPSPRVGRMFKKDAINRAVHRAIVKANDDEDRNGPPVPHWTPYQLRYTRLREIRKAAGREAAQAIAGHSTATMTDHYAPANWGRAARAAQRSG